MRPYILVVFRDETTDDEPVYVALNPELDGCVAQGDSMQEAQENLEEYRIDHIEHLLKHNLPVPGPALPEPAWMATTIEEDSVIWPGGQEESFVGIESRVSLGLVSCP